MLCLQAVTHHEVGATFSISRLLLISFFVLHHFTQVNDLNTNENVESDADAGQYMNKSKLGNWMLVSYSTVTLVCSTW